jgi:hypothetical protein
MKADHEALDRKRRWLESVSQHSVPALDATAAERFVAAFAQLTAPESEGPRIEYITINSTFSPTASSRKPGNILLSWRKLVDIVPDVTLAGVGAATAPVWALPLAGLYIWNKLWRGSEEQFSDVEAITILALWKSRNGEDRVSEEDGFFHTNKLRVASGQSEVTRAEYSRAITRLIKVQCIEVEKGVIWLREWIRVKY